MCARTQHGRLVPSRASRPDQLPVGPPMAKQHDRVSLGGGKDAAGAVFSVRIHTVHALASRKCVKMGSNLNLKVLRRLEDACGPRRDE